MPVGGLDLGITTSSRTTEANWKAKVKFESKYINVERAGRDLNAGFYTIMSHFSLCCAFYARKSGGHFSLFWEGFYCARRGFHLP